MTATSHFNLEEDADGGADCKAVINYRPKVMMQLYQILDFSHVLFLKLPTQISNFKSPVEALHKEYTTTQINPPRRHSLPTNPQIRDSHLHRLWIPETQKEEQLAEDFTVSCDTFVGG